MFYGCRSELCITVRVLYEAPNTCQRLKVIARYLSDFLLSSCFVFGISTQKVPSMKYSAPSNCKSSSTQHRPHYKADIMLGLITQLERKWGSRWEGWELKCFFFSPSSLFKFTLRSIWWQVVQSCWIGSGPDSPPRPSHMANLSEQTQWKQQQHSPRL